MSQAMPGARATDLQISKGQEYRVNVTSFIKGYDSKNVRGRIFDLLASGKGKLEITEKEVDLCFKNRFDRQAFVSQI